MSEAETADPAANVRYHFLDVGGQKYGECILVECGGVRVLIDGGHQTDFRGQRGYDSIPRQLTRILGGSPPYDITLLVVTHGHDDHVGCTLDLVERNVIRPSFALLTHPKLGFGRTADDDDTADAMSPAGILAALLREEDAGDLDDAELQAFMDSVMTVEQRYAALVKALGDRGVDVELYTGQRLPQRIARAVQPTGMVLLGPDEEQILRCAEQISTTNREADAAMGGLALADAADLMDIYRELVGSDLDDAIRNPRGNGMNCQSITLAFGPPGARALIAGDMQFAEPGVAGADAAVARLRRKAIAHGPYKLYKTTHHTSHNGQDDPFLDELGSPPLIVHSGGVRDASHPYPSVLQALRRRRGIRFARTDRNGAITVEPHKSVATAITVQRGELNDFSPNRPDDVEPRASPPPPVLPAAALAQAGAAGGLQVVIVNLPNAPVDVSVAGVDIVIRPQALPPPGGPGGGDPDPQADPPAPPGAFTIGRDLRGLLFVTNPQRLRANIGAREADLALAAIRAAGGQILTGAGAGLPGLTTAALKSDPRLKGVVILGGYDVVPSVRTDAIGSELRNRLGAKVEEDHDEFWVWSDRLYGDTDGDHLAETPVSRIPDARDASLVFAALNARPFQAGRRFGVRNVARPFADNAWSAYAGPRKLEVSETFVDGAVDPAHLEAPLHYFMLHGSDADGRSFVGEYTTKPGYPRAFTVGNVPSRFVGVAFSGCCWGALVVEGKALDAVSSIPAPRTREASIALSYLRAGALAFIGCTGSHYSGPAVTPDNNLAYRLHDAFFRRMAGGETPARAILGAQEEYLAWILGQGRRLEPDDAARRLKNVAQFTCLGLGW